MFEELDFVYCPTRDVAADLAHYVDGLGAEVVFAIEAFDTRVAMVRLAPVGPAVLLAEHLHGEAPILLYRVPDLAVAEAELAERDTAFGSRFGFPDGEGVEVELPGPQRIAVYERTRPGRSDSLLGRRDF